MSFDSSGPPLGSGARKVAIPRLQRSIQPLQKPTKRVSRACTACRLHKIRCSGDSPQCKHCENTGRECVYILPRKDRLKTMTERCGQMSSMLKKLRGFANEDDSARIEQLLDAAEEEMIEGRHKSPTHSNPDTSGEEAKDSSSLPDNQGVEHPQRRDAEPLGILDENLHDNDQSRSTGFVGMNSEVQWLRSFLLLQRDEGESTLDSASPSPLSSNEQVSNITYYLDNEKMDPESRADPYELPVSDVAEHLLNVYMEKVHDSFPILPRKLFEDQCRKYFQGLRFGSAPRLNTKWQAILNLVFAIGAKYSHLANVKTGWQGEAQNHLAYHSRALTFGWNESTLAQHPDLPQIQVAGLLAFYYLSVGQISRAWVVIGIALRFATSLGLHVRNEDPSASSSKREVLIRVWWSLYYLERQISIMTGRPCVIAHSYCSVPLPAPFADQQNLDDVSLTSTSRRVSLAPSISPVAHSHPHPGAHSMGNVEYTESSRGTSVVEANSGSYFRVVVQLSIIKQSILESLYSAGIVIRSSHEIQQTIIQYSQQLDNWVAKLPDDFNFKIRRPSSDPPDAPFFRERTLLTFQFCSAKILLTRPCLGGIDKFDKHLKDATSAEFTRKMANICVDTAKMVLDLLPDQAHLRFAYEHGPWWAIVHSLMQALAVFLLALSCSTGVIEDDAVLPGYCLKIVRWLGAMENPLGERAYRVAHGCYELVANRLSLPRPNVPMEGHLAVSGLGHGMPTQAAHPRVHPMTTAMAYGSSLATAGYSGLQGNPSHMYYLNPGASTGMFGQPGQEPSDDSAFFRNRSDV